jgi:hypothetical protein
MTSSHKSRRIAVLINYLCIVIVLVIFHLVRSQNLSAYYLLAEIIPLLGIVLSFKQAFVKTRLWKLTHSTIDKLDERELQMVYRSSSISYSIYTILSIVLIYVFILAGHGVMGVLSAACLLYFAHSLPAVIIAWAEKKIDTEV